MTQQSIKLEIPFDVLIDTIGNLNLKEKRLLWGTLEEQIALSEKNASGNDPVFQAKIKEARPAYAVDDCLTTDEYSAQQKRNPTDKTLAELTVNEFKNILNSSMDKRLQVWWTQLADAIGGLRDDDNGAIQPEFSDSLKQAILQSQAGEGIDLRTFRQQL